MKAFLPKTGIFTVVFLIANLFFASIVFGQVTQPTIWTKAYDQVSGTGNTTSFAIANGSNRILVVAISSNTSGSGIGADPSTISYGGVTLTKATSNAGNPPNTSGRMHTYLYYLKDNAVMDNTSRPLNVTVAGTLLNMTVYYAVFANVNQTGTYTVGNNLNNGGGSGPAQLSAAMAVNANDQAIYITSIYNDTNTTLPGYTINGNWTSGGSNTGTGGGLAWKIEVAKRNIPVTNTTDAAATSAITPTGTIRYAMSAISLPAAPTITTSSITGSPFCAGATVTVPYTIGGTYTAGNVFTAQLSNASGSFASPISIGTNTSTSAGSITATIPNGQASGTGYRIRVVSSTPSVTGSNNGSDLIINALPTANAGAALSAICQGGTSAALGGSVGGSATGGTWSDGGIGGTFSPSDTDLNATWTPLSGYSGTATLTLTTSGGLCGTKTASKTQVVNIQPTASAGGSQSICANQTATINGTATNGTILWTVGDGATTGTFDDPTKASPVFIPNQFFSGTAILTMTVSNGNCTPATATYTVNVNASPVTVDPGADSTHCMTTPEPISLFVDIQGNVSTGTWSDNGHGGTFFPDNTESATSYTPPSVIDGDLIKLTFTSANPGGSCPGALSASRNITIYKKPTAEIGVGGAPTSQTICANGSATVSGAGASNGTISWTTPNGSGQLTNAATLTPTYTPDTADSGNTVILRMTVSNNHCSPTFVEYPITINSLPPVGSIVLSPVVGVDPNYVSLSLPATVCSGTSNVQIQVDNSEFGFLYQLKDELGNAVGANVYGNGGTIYLTIGTLNNTTSSSIIKTYHVSVKNDVTNCEVEIPTITTTITVNPPPVNRTVTPTTAIVCSGGTINITVGATGTGNGTLSTTSYQLRMYNGTDNIPIGSPVTGNNGVVTFSTGNLTNATSSPITMTFNVLATITTTGCTAQMSVTSSVTVNPVIANNIISSDQFICSSTTPATLTGVPTGGTGTYSYSWFQSTDNFNTNNVAASGYTNPGTNPVYSPPALTQSMWYRRTVTSGGCSSTSTAVKITVNPLPTSTYTVTGGGAYCAGGAGTPIGLSNSQTNVNYQLYLGATPDGAPVAGSNGSVITFGNRTAAGIYTVRATDIGAVGGTNCTSNMTGSATIIVKPVPVTTGVTICPGGSGSFTSSEVCALGAPIDTGALNINAGLGVNVPINFNMDWATPNNIAGAGNATLTNLGVGTDSDYLRGTNYDFSAIPANAVIMGIQVRINRSGSSVTLGGLNDAAVFLVKDVGGSPVIQDAADNKAKTTVWPTTLTIDTYGSTTDKWGLNWTVSDVKSANFGVALVAHNGAFGTRNANVDFMQITVYYSVNGILNWYTASSGGSSIGTGSPFNPVGVLNSGLANTNTPGTTHFYAECSSVPGCRTETNFVVKPLPTMTCPPDSSVCVDTAAYLLTGASPAGGTYSGTGVSANNFNPATAGVGPHTITYSYTDTAGNGCSNSCSFTITVNPLPTLTCPSNSSVCVDAAVFALTGASPAGGTYSGTGVSANNFDPATAEVGPHTITYTFTDGNGCSNSCTFTITVNPLPILTCPSNSSVCIDAVAYELTGASPAGGTYSGTGVSANNFDPTTAGVGPHTITYTYTDGNGCSNSCTFTITVNPLPIVSCPSDSSVCLNTASYALTGASPVGGTYSGTGVSANNFDPAAAGVGPHMITYSYTDGNGCSNSCTFTITVNTLPTVSCPSDSSVCVDAAVYALTGASPAGGTYSGTGVSANNFDPATAGVGSHTITYTYMEEVGCSNSCTFTITVNPLPIVTCPSNSSVCVDAAAYALTGASPAGGTYSGTGVSANNFDPTAAGVGPHMITYTYTDGNGCSNSCTFTITVNALPTVTCPSDSSVCLNTASYALTGASPVGGTYSGTGVSANNFDPATAGVGPHMITYTYTDGNGCSNSCTFTITVKTLPTVSCPSDSSVCVDAAAYALTGASPSGGTYSGTGVSANNFYPATAGVGPHTITYTYTDGDSCSNSCTFTITVNPLPTLTCPSNSSVCVDSAPYALTGASPSGGTYSGTGVSANNFNPATAGVGPHTITYSYTDGNGCSNSCTFTITVNETVVASGTKVNVLCKGGANGSIDLSVSGGGGSYTYQWSNGETTQDISGLAAGTYTVTITESNGCTITGTTSFTIGEPSEVLDASITASSNVDCFGNTNGSATVTATGGTPEYTYLWDDALAQTTATATNLATGTYHVTVTDANGCTDTATATIIVDDNELPTVITKNIEVALNPTSVSIIASDVNDGSHDNCAIQSMSVSPNSFTCLNVGPNTVTLTVTDTNGKVNTGTAIVTVKDTIKPVISNMPANKTVNLSGGNCSALVKWNAPSAADNCGVASLVSSDETFNENGSTLLGSGTHTIIYTATDVNGNTETASFIITVIDNVAPTITNCPSNITVNNENNICGARVFYIQPNVNDCNGATLSINNNGIDNNSYLSGNIFPVGTTTVIWTATDGSANHNQSSCSFTVTVIDNQAPVPNVASLPTVNAECSVTVTAPTALDNCDGTVTGVSDVGLTFSTAGPHTIVWTYTDSHGKSSSQNQTVNVTSSSPVINTQPVSLTKCEGQPATFSVSATAATGYQWQVDVGGGWGNLSSETNSSLNIASVTNEMNGIHYRVIVKGSCGDIISDEVTLTVYGMITVSDQPNQTLCNTSSFTMTQTAPSVGQQGKWTLINGSASITDENSPTTTITAVAVGTSAKVRWTVTNGYCSVSDDVTVTNSILPSVSNQPDQTLCNTSSFTMTQSAPSVGTGVWSIVSGDGGVTITPIDSPTATVSGVAAGASAKVKWTVTNVSCSAFDEVTVTNAILQAVSDQPNQTLCNTSSFTMTQTAPPVGNGQWSVVSGNVGIPSPNSPTATVTGLALGTSATVRWTVTSGSCTSSDDVVLTNTALPTVSNQPDQTQCNTSTFTMTQSGSGTWSLVSGSATITTAGSPTTTITGVAVGTSATVRWTVGSGSCTAYDDVTVTNNTAAPTVSNQPDQTQCNNSTFTMTQSGSGTWTLVSGSATITTAGSPTTTITGVALGTSATVRWTVGSGSCTAFDDVTVTNNNAVPTVSNQPDQTQCNTSTFTMTQSGSGIWTLVSGSATITTAGSPTTTITGVAVGTSATVRWTVGSGSCTAFDDVTVTNNNAAPAVSNQPDQTQCNSSTFTMTQSGSGVWSFVGSSGSAIITTPSSPTTTITGVAVGTNVTVRWTVGSGSCTAYDEVKLTNNSGSSFTASIATSSPDAFCSGLKLTANSSVAGSYTYLWSPGGATTQSITLNNSSNAGTYTVTVTQQGGCNGTAQASYNFQPQNVINDYTILGMSNVSLGDKNFVQTGSVGVTTTLGYANIGTNSTVAGPGAFVKARFITVQSGSNVPARIYSPAVVVLPNMQVNSTSTTGLADLSIPNNTTVTKTGNYKNVTIGTNCNVTFTTGTIFGTISIGKSSQVKFNANSTGVLNVNSISLAEGTDAAPTKLLFASDISVRVKTTVSIGKSSMVNPTGGYKAVFFIGGNEFRVLPGGNVTVNASVFAPNGTIKVDGDAAAVKNTNMKGFYIGSKVASTNKNVYWNQFDCSNPSAKTGGIENIVAKEIEPTIIADPFDVKAYPNPSNYQFTLEVEGGSVEKIEVEVYDMGGRHIKHIESDFNQSIVFGEELPAGTYLTIVSQGSNRKALKLIKK
ncbi:putative secreted protein (Por secretion system target) [Flavobacterium sp. 103]|uniref:HYR domain-containing protein n=1 Tax=Flavobacterium sp. 103 TaxID=2135624 RepID=UPI000D5F3F0C|nr:HYR domain-containing protein [Flavobacterium sp. 103]PVX45014.1 putative secreted protein (Por secretion system target) [Flavobacterium sp. 103]